MARSLSSAISTALDGRVVYYAWFVQFAVDSGDINFWTGSRSVTFGGDTYTGAGDLLRVEPASEVTRVEPQPANIVLSGIPNTNLSLALTEDYQNRNVFIKLGLSDDDFETLIDGTLITIFSGQIDQMIIEEEAGKANVNIKCESNLVDVNNQKLRRYTDQDQQLILSGDESFELITSIQDKRISFGGKAVSTGVFDPPGSLGPRGIGT